MVPAPGRAQDGRMVPLSVLVVDDNPGDRDLLAAYLEKASGVYELTFAATVSEAIACSEKTTINVVLLDLGLPDSQGLETFRRFHSKSNRLPVVVVTGLDDDDTGREAIAAGAQDYLPKNRIDIDILARAIRFAIERNEAHAQLDHLNRVLRAIRNVNQLIVRESDPAALVRNACELLIETRGYNGAWIALGDGAVPATVFAEAGWGDSFGRFRELLRQGRWPDCLDDALAAEECHVIAEPATQCSECPLAKQYGDNFAAVTALRHGRKTFGLLGVSFPTSMMVDDQERALLVEVAGDLAFALHDIEKVRQRDQAVGETNALLRANQVVLGSPDFPTAAKRVFDICKEQTGATAGYVALREGENENAVVFLDDGGSECTVDPSLPMPIRGLRAEAYDQGRVVYDNAFESSSHVKLLPTGHATLRNVMFVPFMLDGTVQGIIGLANKNGDFNQEDARRAKALGEVAAIALQRNLHIEALKQHEEKLQRAQEVARLGHWELNSYNGSPTWSDEIFRMFGLSPGVGEPSFTKHGTIIHPAEWPVLDRAVRAGFEHGEPFDLVFRILRPDRQPGWMHAIGTATRDDQGKVVGMFGTAQDVTERLQVEDALRESRQLLEGILDSIPARVFWKDKNLVYLGCNSAFARDAGFASPRDIIGKNDYQMGWRDQAEMYRSSDREAIEHGVSKLLYEEPQTTPTGSTITLLTSKLPLRSATGEVTGVLGTYMDITEHKLLQAQLAQADRLSSMGALAAGVAHEINNPLSYILYNLESLSEDLPALLDVMRQLQAWLDNEVDPKILQDLVGDARQKMNAAALEDILSRFKEALGGTHRIRDIARGLGAFSRVEKDQLVPVNLMHVIDVAINMAFNEIKYRARLVKDYAKTPTVLASEGRLSQVFLNLIINAAHAITEGDVESNEIRVRTWTEAEEVCAEVRDTGSGIAPEHVGKIFEPFFTTKKIGVGSGLGLAISKSIVEGYKGTIQVSSEVGKGTSFIVRLPVRRQEEAVLEMPSEATAVPCVRGRILIVDDEAGIRSAMARMLRDHETVQAADGAEAIAILEVDQAFDLVLCDMMMPDISGMDLHEWLAERQPRLAKQLIFITGGAFTPRARDYLNKVDNIRLEKPFDVANFKKIVGDRIQMAKGTRPG